MKFIEKFFEKYLGNTNKKIENINREAVVLYESLSEITKLVKELRRQVEKKIETRVEKEDLPIYNLKNGLCPEPHILIGDISRKQIKNAEARMQSYRELQLSRLKDMEAFKVIVVQEAKDAIQDLKDRYGIE